MSATGSVTADELVRALQRRHTTLPAEIGSFIALEACESMLAQGPREIFGLAHVLISEAGQVSLSGTAAEEAAGARSVGRIHGALLDAAGSAVPPPLRRIASEAADAGAPSLRALRDQLEASLVPLNRNASRRVLARFARETAIPPVAREEVDAALSSLLGVGAGPANDVGSPADAARQETSDVSPLQVDLFDGLDLETDEPGYPATAAARDSRRPQAHALDEARSPSIRPSFAPHRGAMPERFQSLRAGADELEEEVDPATLPRTRRLFVGFSFLALAVAGIALALSLRPAGRARTATAPVAETRVERATGRLVVSVSEPNAQVLMLVGKAPVEVRRLRVGRPHELVATADGYRPTRVLVPAEAEWDTGEHGPRYEVALQLDEPAMEPDAALELGPSKLPAGAARGADGEALGTVRVVTTPRGARVYRLLGRSPEVTVDQLAIEDGVELLVYREGFQPEVRRVGRDAFSAEGDARVARVQVELARR